MKDEPDLGAPGAGLPPRELFVTRILFGTLSRVLPQSAFYSIFLKERSRILTLIGGLTEEAKDRRVLIERVRAIEDNSRNWSVFMTLEHMAIVDEGVTGIIALLTKEAAVPGQVRIQDVKPCPDTGGISEKLFATTLKKSERILQGLGRIPSDRTHPHPWFGPLTARQWYALRCVHLRIHRRQIEAIISGLN